MTVPEVTDSAPYFDGTDLVLGTKTLDTGALDTGQASEVGKGPTKTKVNFVGRCLQKLSNNKRAAIIAGVLLAAGIAAVLLATLVPHSAWQSLEHTLNQHVWTHVKGFADNASTWMKQHPFLTGGIGTAISTVLIGAVAGKMAYNRYKANKGLTQLPEEQNKVTQEQIQAHEQQLVNEFFKEALEVKFNDEPNSDL